ncbi:predicted protein [Plenodomus lingam JN3]|uniref:Predicted protein n=1 Tax=Leptosphaeria maculans (strain JN3 / isolate v23.1.3 / race Av1-4-5-6-7-8) TaxID=985895 RepID=E4ZT19_LEPMJ|nr:predicted protein [Plenodomus lingam JN3]CBX94450.1 predicted protein [Plenodomus lingam JN3]
MQTESHIRDVESNATVQDIDLIGQFEVGQPIQQHSHQQMQPESPAVAACQEENECDLERTGWRNEVEGRRQRVSRYTSFLRSLRSVHAPSSNDDGLHSDSHDPY